MQHSSASLQLILEKHQTSVIFILFLKMKYNLLTARLRVSAIEQHEHEAQALLKVSCSSAD